MDALGSITPIPSVPDTRPSLAATSAAFSMEGVAGDKDSPSQPPERPPAEIVVAASASSPALISPSHHEPLAEACSLASGGATSEAQARVAELLVLHPHIGSAAQLWRDERGAPIQALPALTCAALRGLDPEGWWPVLAALGVSFDTRLARSEAREELMEMQGPRGGRITAINARLDALSLWILACAEADHPEAAIRAIERARQDHPDLLGPLSSEAAHFGDDSILDKPGLSPAERALAFLRAGLALEGFLDTVVPIWAQGPRGMDLASAAEAFVRILSPIQARILQASLSLAEEQTLGVRTLSTQLLVVLDAQKTSS